MRTNLEKWKHYRNIINLKYDEFFKEELEKIPKVIYNVTHTGQLESLNIESIDYKIKPFYDYKVTNKNVEEIKKYSESLPELTSNDILIHYRVEDSYTGSFRYTEMSKYFLSKDEAVTKQNRILDKKKEEEELLANGHIRCAYHGCNKVIKKEDSVKRSITYRINGGLKKSIDEYCKGACAGYAQMACEG